MAPGSLEPDETASMGHHTFDPDRADLLEDTERYVHLSAEELVGAIDGASEGTVLDLGSGTGFYTDDLAPHVGRLVGVDLQPAMHRYYRQKGIPDNVNLVIADVSALPVRSGVANAVISTMTYHEFAGEAATEELARILVPNGRLVIADWSANGTGENGPPLAERFTAAEIKDTLDAGGFTVIRAVDRIETALVVADRTGEP